MRKCAFSATTGFFATSTQAINSWSRRALERRLAKLHVYAVQSACQADRVVNRRLKGRQVVRRDRDPAAEAPLAGQYAMRQKLNREVKTQALL
jgi:hypothetical protein